MSKGPLPKAPFLQTPPEASASCIPPASDIKISVANFCLKLIVTAAERTNSAGLRQEVIFSTSPRRKH